MHQRKLYLIPARGGSVGIPRKNIKPLAGKPLIHYTIELARAFAPDPDICVSTDDAEIRDVARQTGLPIPFMRPASLSGNQAGMRGVMLHALDYYAAQGIHYEQVVLLQPTSPLRRTCHLKTALSLWHHELDMVVSVQQSKSNPYFNLYEENPDGYLERSKVADFPSRQQCPPVYAYNGAIYIIRAASIRQHAMYDFRFIRKYVMDAESSLDIDTPLDWELAEILIANRQYETADITCR